MYVQLFVTSIVFLIHSFVTSIDSFQYRTFNLYLTTNNIDIVSETYPKFKSKAEGAKRSLLIVIRYQQYSECLMDLGESMF